MLQVLSVDIVLGNSTLHVALYSGTLLLCDVQTCRIRSALASVVRGILSLLESLHGLGADTAIASYQIKSS